MKQKLVIEPNDGGGSTSSRRHHSVSPTASLAPTVLTGVTSASYDSAEVPLETTNKKKQKTRKKDPPSSSTTLLRRLRNKLQDFQWKRSRKVLTQRCKRMHQKQQRRSHHQHQPQAQAQPHVYDADREQVPDEQPSLYRGEDVTELELVASSRPSPPPLDDTKIDPDHPQEIDEEKEHEEEHEHEEDTTSSTSQKAWISDADDADPKEQHVEEEEEREGEDEDDASAAAELVEGWEQQAKIKLEDTIHAVDVDQDEDVDILSFFLEEEDTDTSEHSSRPILTNLIPNLLTRGLGIEVETDRSQDSEREDSARSDPLEEADAEAEQRRCGIPEDNNTDTAAVVQDAVSAADYQVHHDESFLSTPSLVQTTNTLLHISAKDEEDNESLVVMQSFSESSTEGGNEEDDVHWQGIFMAASPKRLHFAPAPTTNTTGEGTNEEDDPSDTTSGAEETMKDDCTTSSTITIGTTTDEQPSTASTEHPSAIVLPAALEEEDPRARMLEDPAFPVVTQHRIVVSPLSSSPSVPEEQEEHRRTTTTTLEDEDEEHSTAAESIDTAWTGVVSLPSVTEETQSPSKIRGASASTQLLLGPPPSFSSLAEYLDTSSSGSSEEDEADEETVEPASALLVVPPTPLSSRRRRRILVEQETTIASLVAATAAAQAEVAQRERELCEQQQQQQKLAAWEGASTAFLSLTPPSQQNTPTLEEFHDQELVGSSPKPIPGHELPSSVRPPLSGSISTSSSSSSSAVSRAIFSGMTLYAVVGMTMDIVYDRMRMNRTLVGRNTSNRKGSNLIPNSRFGHRHRTLSHPETNTEILDGIFWHKKSSSQHRPHQPLLPKLHNHDINAEGSSDVDVIDAITGAGTTVDHEVRTEHHPNQAHGVPPTTTTTVVRHEGNAEEEEEEVHRNDEEYPNWHEAVTSWMFESHVALG